MSAITRDMEARRPGVLEGGGLPEKSGVDARSLVPDPGRPVNEVLQCSLNGAGNWGYQLWFK